jgi:hypothetical protein
MQTRQEVIAERRDRERSHLKVVAALIMPLILGAGGAPTESTLSAAKPDAALIDKGEVGIATYAMLFVIVVLIVDRYLDRRANGKLADAIDRAAKSDYERSTALLVQMARTESVLGRIERNTGLEGGHGAT